MKQILLSAALAAYLGFPGPAFAGTYSCSSNSNGAPIILNSDQPGRSFTVLQAKKLIAKRIQKLKDQRTAVKANKNLSKQKRQEKIETINAALDELKIASDVAKNCKSGDSCGPAFGNTVAVFQNTSFQCDPDPSKQCSYSGSVRIVDGDPICTRKRNVFVRKGEFDFVGQGQTADTTLGEFSFSLDNHGPGTYTVELSAKTAEDVYCAGSINTYSLSSQGVFTLVKQRC